MKYFKLLMLVAAVVCLGSCDETADESTPWNTASGVTVSMRNATVNTKEGAGIIRIPVDVKGENKNGKVSFVVECKEVGSNPAIEDTHYYVTDKTLTCSDSTVNVELRIADDKEINETRTFELTLVSAEHASLGENTTTLVNISDNDSAPYDRIQGKYRMTADIVGDDGTASETETWEVTITGATDENSPEYNKILYIHGMGGYSGIDTQARLDFTYNASSEQGHVEFNHFDTYWFAEDVPFQDPANAKVRLMYYDGSNISASTPVLGYWNSDFTSVEFDPGMLAGVVYDSTGANLYGLWFLWNNIRMTKIDQ